MRMLDKIGLRLRSLFQRRDVERELEAELGFHLDQLIEENIASGMPPAQARTAALPPPFPNPQMFCCSPKQPTVGFNARAFQFPLRPDYLTSTQVVQVACHRSQVACRDLSPQ